MTYQKLLIALDIPATKASSVIAKYPSFAMLFRDISMTMNYKRQIYGSRANWKKCKWNVGTDVGHTLAVRVEEQLFGVAEEISFFGD